MIDYMELGCVPSEEECAQVGTADYSDRAKRECRALREQLRRIVGPEPDGAKLVIKANSHDYGTYYEVACRYDEAFPQAVAYAYLCEEHFPARWDAFALATMHTGPICPNCDQGIHDTSPDTAAVVRCSCPCHSNGGLRP